MGKGFVEGIGANKEGEGVIMGLGGWGGVRKG